MLRTGCTQLAEVWSDLTCIALERELAVHHENQSVEVVERL